MHSSATTVPNCQSLKPTKNFSFQSLLRLSQDGWLSPWSEIQGGQFRLPPSLQNEVFNYCHDDDYHGYDDREGYMMMIVIPDDDSNVSGLARPLFVHSLLPNSLSWSQWQGHLIFYLFYHQGFKTIFFLVLFFSLFFGRKFAMCSLTRQFR